jgi:hypothetical protein
MTFIVNPDGIVYQKEPRLRDLAARVADPPI